MSTSDLLHVLTERGFVHQCTDEQALREAADAGIVSGYIGFDATASSLHAGSLLPIMMLHWLQQAGHRPVVLMGGGTTKIGDPSGKTEARKMLTPADIEANIAGIKNNFAPFLSFGDGPTDAVMVNNAEWLDALEYIPFLRDIGPHFTINRMLTMDSVKLRLDREQPLTFLEFNYMILQSYDFVELNKRFGVTLQMGGSDQWGNIVNGVDLGRRVLDKTLFGLTCPLLTTASGQKMGKTHDGAVWLDAQRCSPYDYWQYWRNTEDADVGRFLRLFTTLPMDEIGRLEALEGQELNDAKKVLATEATALLHGREAADAAARTATETFESGGLGADLPTIDVAAADLDAGILNVELFLSAGLVSSKGEARRDIQGGALKVNDAKVTELADITSADMVGGVIKLSKGKKKHVIIQVV